MQGLAISFPLNGQYYYHTSAITSECVTLQTMQCLTGSIWFNAHGSFSSWTHCSVQIIFFFPIMASVAHYINHYKFVLYLKSVSLPNLLLIFRKKYPFAFLHKFYNACQFSHT